MPSRKRYNDSNSYGSFDEYSVGTPGFHKLKGSGGILPQHAYHFDRWDVSDPVVPAFLNAAYNVRGWLGGSNSSSQLFTFCDAMRLQRVQLNKGSNPLTPPKTIQGFSAWQPELQNALLRKCRNREIDLGVSLGEYRETSKFISDAMVKTARSYRQLRRGNLAQALQTLGLHGPKANEIAASTSNAWLGYTYGLKPLLNDVYAAADILHKRYGPAKADVQHVVSEARVTFPKRVSERLLSQHVSAEWVGIVKCQGVVRYYTDNPLLSQLDAIGVLNPASVAWELVPFSFVVDWFVPIGSWIQNVVPPQGVSFVSGHLSYKATGFARYVIAIPPNPLNNGDIGLNCQAETVEFLKERIILSNFPRYSFVVPDLSLSQGQIASGIALLYQQLGSSRK